MRELFWDGCTNTRDLGGLRTASGRLTTWGAAVRSDHPAKLSATGWLSLLDHGVRTIIELRTEGVEKVRADTAPRPSELSTVSIAIEDATDPQFKRLWVANDLWSTPLYYTDALERWPERHAQVIAAFAQAAPGGVLVHCERGQDRTGIVSVLLLSLVGVAAADIAADYALSHENLPPQARQSIREAVARENQTVRSAVLAAAKSADEAERYLKRAGLDGSTLKRARARLVGS